MVDIRAALIGVQRRDVVAHPDALAQLLERWQRQLLAQLRLSDKDDLDQLIFIRLEVREHADLLQQAQAEILRLVDDEHDVVAGGSLLHEELVQLAEERQPVVAHRVEAEVLDDRVEQLEFGEIGMQNERGFGERFQLAQERLAEGRLAGADLAGDFDEPFALPDAIDHVGERFAVLPGEIEKVGVCRIGKRFFPQAEKFKIHPSYCSAPPDGTQAPHELVSTPNSRRGLTEQSTGATVYVIWLKS